MSILGTGFTAEDLMRRCVDEFNYDLATCQRIIADYMYMDAYEDRYDFF